MINLVTVRRLRCKEEVVNGIAFLTERGTALKDTASHKETSAYPIEVLMSDEASYITGFNLEVMGRQ